ncbi:MAG: CpaF family protein [Chloroflexi bacterium]|nr:CpaF family protein [Chloroflexota bacterium]
MSLIGPGSRGRLQMVQGSGPLSSMAAERTEAAARPPVAPAIDQERFKALKQAMVARLSSGMDPAAQADTAEAQQALNERFQTLYKQAGLQLSDEQQRKLFEEVKAEIIGFGPIEPLLKDDSISEVMVNGFQQVYVERRGEVKDADGPHAKVELTDVRFDDDDHVLRIIQRIIAPLGRRIDRRWPMVDARLPDGSRVNAIIPPCAIDGPTLTIRKFTKEPLDVDDLIRFRSMTPSLAEFLKACVVARLNIVISGGTGSGKTTLLNVLSSFIPEEERIVTIEDAAELQLDQVHVVRLEAKPAELDGTGQVAIRDLVINALRMRPERIVVGECRGREALDMLQAMNTGHEGSMTTAHANSPRDTLGRFETMTLMAGMDLPVKVVRQHIASAFDLIVQVSRLIDGSRKITQVTEVQGMEGDLVVLQDIFVFKEQGMKDGKVLGSLEPMGIRPKFTPRLEARGFRLPPEVFGETSFAGRSFR